MLETQKATAAEIKRYFDIPTMQEFKAQWQVLSEADKEFFRIGVGRVLHG